MAVDTERAADLDAAMDLMASGDHDYRYSVAWIDCQSTGRGLGRSVLTRGDHARYDQLPERLRRPASRPRAFRPRHLCRCPSPRPAVYSTRSPWEPSTRCGSARRPGARSGRSRPWPAISIRSTGSAHGTASMDRGAFCSTSSWWARATARWCGGSSNRSPGPGWPRSLPCSSGSDRAARDPSRSPCPGWTLALDLPVGTTSSAPCSTSSTTRWRRPGVGSTWPRTRGSPRPPSGPCIPGRRWQAVRDRVDPDGVLRSDLGRRLGLCPDRPVAPASRVARARRPPSAAPDADALGPDRPGRPRPLDRRNIVMIDAIGRPQSVLVLGGSSEIARAMVATLVPGAMRTVVLAGRPGSAPRPSGRGGHARPEPR